ncbi:hypothetical protein N7520_006344 [Penicillium odoratum]|uniref:uncharacterized protein n=1 Tax=Penicillium odoratum TaxID=1167516 RepID=UPI002547D3F0|nr:uncharacterized protein N7520_006344 [Penicillium odoratum]KAJ5759188.1 hypothetical protein N7520_006344 [Penicillium odoratum]
MATDYSKKTNAELVEVLKARSLPHTGKKADLVARIQEDDEKQAGAPAAPASKTDAADDVIDWDDDVPTESTITEKPTTEASAHAIAAGGKGAVANPVAVPNQKLDIDPATTDELKVESAGEVVPAATEPVEETEKKPAVDYTRGLPATELEEELRKRKARAEKFGIIEDKATALEEAEKSLQRVKRFGTGAEADSTASAGVKGLDQALPDEKSRKRARNDQGGQSSQGGRGGKRRDHGRNRNRRGDDQNRRGGNNGASASSGQKNKDTLAMEARKKRFATAA